MVKSKLSQVDRVSFWQPLSIRNFLLLFIGENISLLGDQFYLVALPWLTIQLTNSGVSLGAVLMAAAIPRAAILLLGGIASDRVSPRLVMLISNALRGVVVILLTILVVLELVEVWHLYVLSIAFGILDGFFIPASKAIVPSLVKKQMLIPANTLNQGTNQLILTLGPALGGILIATFGLESVFAIDAATFVFTTIILLFIKSSRETNKVHTPSLQSTQFKQARFQVKISSLMVGIQEGINYAWHNMALRTMLLIVMFYNLIFIGPLQIGMTSLAHNRFPGGAIALGVMNSAWGGGGLLGALMPSLLPRIPGLGKLLLYVGIGQGTGLVLLGFAPNVTLASLAIAILGFCSCFFIVTETAWIQKQTPPDILGRVMSLRMLASFGISPFSFALAGLLVDFNMTFMFTLAGLIILITIAYLAANPFLRKIK